LAESDGKLGLAGFGRVFEGFSGAVGFRGLEIESALFQAIGEAGEAGFAVDVGDDFEVKLMEAAESIGDVDFDFGGIDGLAGFVGDGEVSAAGVDAGVDGRDGVRVGSLGQRRNGDEESQKQHGFEHVQDYRRFRRGDHNGELGCQLDA